MVPAQRWMQSIRDSEIFWRYVGNWQPWLLHRLFPPVLDDVQRRLLGQLRGQGIAITSVEELGVEGAFVELENFVRAFDGAMARDLERRRERAEAPGFKTYLFELLGPRPVLRAESICVRFSLQPSILNVVNSYFGMFTRLRQFNLWRNFATAGAARNSQLWHRDPEDRQLVKLFVYLSDVDHGAGPLSYVPGTHILGHIRVHPDAHLEEAGDPPRSSDAQMSAVVPADRWVTATGRKGTVVMVDTSGYHKGGLARDRDRVLYTAMFTSQRSPLPEHFRRAPGLPIAATRSVAFALDGLYRDQQRRPWRFLCDLKRTTRSSG